MSQSSLTASVFLIEINPRVPGHQETFVVEYTYGIDYFALHTLGALTTEEPGAQAEVMTIKTIAQSLAQPLDEKYRYPR
jgi:hypothetical protein